VLDCGAAVLYRFAPRLIGTMTRLAATANLHPGRFFIVLIGVSTLAYAPMARVFTPWEWTEFGPFAFQVSFAPQYVIYFFAGLIVGARGLECGLLDPDGMLAQRAVRWIAAALAVFVMWLLAMAVVVKGLLPGLPGRQIAADLATVLFVGFACFGSMAGFVRFFNTRRPVFRSLAQNGYGIYVFHYFFVLWAQYFLLGIAAFALVKAMTVFGITLVLSWAVSAALGRVPAAARLLHGLAAPIAVPLPASAAAAPATAVLSGSDGRNALPRQVGR
jgi:glucans biosynthesis protein C